MSRTEVRLVESKPPGYAQERFSTSALLVLAACAFGVFLSALDQTVVVTVLPSLITDLHIPFTRLDEAAWIVTGYLLGYTVAMPLVGRLTDAYGWRLTYFLCLSVFTLGSLGCALATSLPWLLTARVVQAAGGGGIVPVSLALASQLFSQRSRSLALGLVGAVAEAGGVLGPLYGALLVEHWGWRWIFLLNAPLSALVAAIILLALRSHPKDRAARISHRPSVDYVGAALVGGSLAFLTIALSQEAGSERPLGLTALLLAVSAGLFALFLRVEKRAAEPLLDLSLFRRPPFSATNLVSFLTGAAFITAMVDVPLFGATVLGLGAVESGLILLRLTVMIPVGALLGGWLSPPGSSANGRPRAGHLCCWATLYLPLASFGRSSNADRRPGAGRARLRPGNCPCQRYRCRRRWLRASRHSLRTDNRAAHGWYDGRLIGPNQLGAGPLQRSDGQRADAPAIGRRNR